MKKYEDLHFCNRDGITYAGTHLILDMWEAKNLSNISIVKKAMEHSVLECGAKLLHIHLHHFGDEMGVTGVALLEESHISIHTWPEVEYAAIDVFLCGNLNPFACVDIFKKYFETDWVTVTETKRGIVS